MVRRSPWKVLIPAVVAGLLAPATLWAQEQVRVDLKVKNRMKRDQAKKADDALGEVSGVKECTVRGDRITVLVEVEGKLKLSDIEDALEGVEQDEKSPLTVLRDKILLKGKIEITVDSDAVDKALIAIRGIRKLTGVSSKGDGVIEAEAVSSGVKYSDLVDEINRKIDKEDNEAKEEDPILDIAWIGPPRPEAKPEPPTQKPPETKKKPGGHG